MAFIDMGKRYDRVDMNKEYGVQEIMVDIIERIYDGSKIQFARISV